MITIYVGADKSCKTINEALAEAKKSTEKVVIEISAGEYTETISFGNRTFVEDGKTYTGGITFKAAEGAEVKINGSFQCNSPGNDIKDVVFDGLEINNSSRNGGYFAPIMFGDNYAGKTASGISVTGCTLNSSTGTAVGTSSGIALTMTLLCDGIDISNNTINADCGVYGGDGNLITNTVISGNTMNGNETVPSYDYWGVVYIVKNGAGNVVSGNTISGSALGAVICSKGAGITFTDNTISDCGDVRFTNGSVVSGNEINGAEQTFPAYNGDKIFVDQDVAGVAGDAVIINGASCIIGKDVFTTLADALNAQNGTKEIVIDSNINEELSGKTLSGIYTADKNFKITDLANSTYVNFTNAEIGENITLDAKYFYLYGRNTFNGDVKSSSTFYSSGKLILNGNAEVYTAMSRYYVNADDGIYVVGTAEAGKGKDADVQFKANNYLGHYSGTFSVKDSAAEFGYILLNGDTDGAGYSKAQLVLDNAKVSTIGGPNTQPGQVLMNGDAEIIAANGSVLNFRGPKDFAYISMGANNSITLTDSELLLGKDGQGKNTLAGTITLDNSKIDSLGKIDSSAAITIDNSSLITATTFAGANGSIAINIAADDFGIWKVIDVVDKASDFGKVTVNNGGSVVDEAGDLFVYNTADALYVNSAWAGEKQFTDLGDGKLAGINAFDTLADIADKINTDGKDTTIVFEDDLTAGNIDFVYGNGDVTFTADKAVTVSQSGEADWGFVTGNVSPTITIGKNVTFEIYSNASGLYVYYGAKLNIEGTVTGGGNWGCTYLAYGEHTVAASGTLSTGRVHLAWTKITVNGTVDTNYILAEDSVFAANNATVDAGVIYDSNNGGMRYGSSEFYFTDSTVTANNIYLQYADSVMEVSGGSLTVNNSFSNNGILKISGAVAVNAAITGKAASVAGGSIISGSLSADLNLEGDITLNADYAGVISGNKNISITSDKVVNIGAESEVASLIVSDGVIFSDGESLGGADIKGAAANAVITVADGLFTGNNFSNGKLAITGADGEIAVNTEISNIHSINGHEVRNFDEKLYFFSDGDKTYILAKDEKGISYTEQSADNPGDYEFGNITVRDDSFILPTFDMTMQEGTSSIKVANGKLIKGGVEKVLFEVGAINKNENGGKNNLSFGNYNDVDIHGVVSAMGDLTIGKKSEVDVYGDITGKNINQSIKVGVDSNVNLKAVDLMGGKNSFNVALGAYVCLDGTLAGVATLAIAGGRKDDRTMMIVNGDYIAAAVNNSIKLGNYADLIINGDISNGGVTSGTGTTLNAGRFTNVNAGVIDGLAALTIGNESSFTAAAVSGTANNNKITFGVDVSATVDGAINLKNGNNSITLKRGAELTAGAVSNVQTINADADSKLNVKSIADIQKLTIGKDGWLDAELISGTDANDTFDLGNGSVAGNFGAIDLNFFYGNDTLKIGNNAIADFGDTDFGAGNDKLTIGSTTKAVFAALDMGAGNDTVTLGKNSKLSVESVSGVETINASKGVEIWFTNGSDDIAGVLDDVKGSWAKNALIMDECGDLTLGSNAGQINYENEWDVYNFTSDKDGTLTLAGDGVDFQYSFNGKDWFVDDTVVYGSGADLMIRVSENDKEKGYSFTATLA